MADVLIKGIEMPKACFKSVDELRMLPCELLCFCRNREGFKEPDELDVKASDCPLCETGWQTGVPTEECDYLVAYYPWGSKEIGICYTGFQWKNEQWYDPALGSYCKPYIVAWQKIDRR